MFIYSSVNLFLNLCISIFFLHKLIRVSESILIFSTFITSGSLSRSQTTVIFINQLRSKIGVMYGNPEVTAGGNALKFYSSVRLDIRRKEVLKDNDGIMVKIKVVKNKVNTKRFLDVLFIYVFIYCFYFLFI